MCVGGNQHTVALHLRARFKGTDGHADKCVDVGLHIELVALVGVQTYGLALEVAVIEAQACIGRLVAHHCILHIGLKYVYECSHIHKLPSARGSRAGDRYSDHLKRPAEVVLGLRVAAFLKDYVGNARVHAQVKEVQAVVSLELLHFSGRAELIRRNPPSRGDFFAEGNVEQGIASPCDFDGARRKIGKSGFPGVNLSLRSRRLAEEQNEQGNKYESQSFFHTFKVTKKFINL